MTTGEPPARPTWLRTLPSVAAVVVAAVVLVDGLHRTAGSVRALSSPTAIAGAQSGSDFYACLEGRLRASTPAGATIFDSSSSPLYYQRIIELLSPDHRFVATASRAQYVVTVVPGTQCGNRAVRVTAGGLR